MNVNDLPQLTALELEKFVTVPKAADIRGVSVDTFRRRFRHIIQTHLRQCDSLNS